VRFFVRRFNGPFLKDALRQASSLTYFQHNESLGFDGENSSTEVNLDGKVNLYFCRFQLCFGAGKTKTCNANKGKITPKQGGGLF
jgi:hypothetical protein